MRAKKAKVIRRQAREIAAKLPTVTTQCIAYKIENGRKVPSHIVEVQSNHVRRIKRAVYRAGMLGLRTYLETINQLQKERNNEASKKPVPNV